MRHNTTPKEYYHPIERGWFKVIKMGSLLRLGNTPPKKAKSHMSRCLTKELMVKVVSNSVALVKYWQWLIAEINLIII